MGEQHKEIVKYSLIFVLSLTFLFLSVSLNAKNKIITKVFDVCTVTVEIYENGELTGTGTYNDNTGDCEYAEAMAYFIAVLTHAP